MLLHLDVHHSAPYMTSCYSHSMGLAVVGAFDLNFGKIVKSSTCTCTQVLISTYHCYDLQQFRLLEIKKATQKSQHKYTLNNHKHNCRTIY
jgi:hypothetical protein